MRHLPVPTQVSLVNESSSPAHTASQRGHPKLASSCSGVTFPFPALLRSELRTANNDFPSSVVLNFAPSASLRELREHRLLAPTHNF